VLARHRARSTADADAAVRCRVMIETAEGLDHVEAICATPGLGGVYIGPADLALGLGLDPGTWPSSTVHAKARARIRTAARDANVVAGLHCTGPDVAREAVAEGFTMVTVGSDAALVRAGAVDALRRARTT
jgi:4-hydroxy-2-oxoheptanedioate aldolase